jgi:integrase/recombinase XerD
MKKIRSHEFESRPWIFLDEEDFQRLLFYPARGFSGSRDRAITALLCQIGLRVSELVALDQDCFEEETGELLCGTGRRGRHLALTGTALESVRQYCSLRALLPSADKALFVNREGKRISRQGVWKMIKERSFHCGITVPISPQGMRRSLTHQCLQQGKDREELCFLLGNQGAASLKEYEKGEKSHGIV